MFAWFEWCFSDYIFLETGMQELNSNNFGDMIKNGIAVVNVGASWCPDCKHIEPIMTKLEKEYSGRVNFFKVSFDNEEQLKEALNIKRIPTLIFYENGEEVGERLIEPKSLLDIDNILRKIL